MRIRSYTELQRLDTFEERFEYLKLRGAVGESTFGFDRYLNQAFYRSTQWRHIRDQVITRDEGCDLGLTNYEIFDRVIIHHMNPMSSKDIVQGDHAILDPEFLVVVSHQTHNAIHYGDIRLLKQKPIVRKPGDTKLW